MRFLNWLWRREVEFFLAAAAVLLLLTCGGC
jgi:hypothetical protein